MGLTHRVYRSGSGVPVVMLHGITTYSFIWNKVIPYLTPDYEVIAPDLLGCGDSSKDISVSYSLSARADRIAALIEQLQLGPVHLVGHDLGGGISQIIAVRYPHLLKSLTLINSVGFDYWPVQPIIAMRTPILRQLVMSTLDLGTFQVIVKRGIFHKDLVTAELMEQFSKPFKASEGRKAFLHFAHCLDNQDLMCIVPQLQQLKIPTLILRGDGDVYLSAAIAERLSQEIPGAQLKRIGTAGHFIQEDEPKWIAESLIHFWRG